MKTKLVGKIKTVALIVFFLLAMLFLWPQHHSYSEERLSFYHRGNHLSGILAIPKNREGPFPVAVFVHGDGATAFDGFGYYRPLWEKLTQAGIAVFSWDKPGVGGSTGNWLDQSMDDRADEVIAAMAMLKKRADLLADKIGLIGYSQAGWVLPLVARKISSLNFMVVVSGAINWMDQGVYLTKTHLTSEGYSEAQIQQELRDFRQRSAIDLAPETSYETYLKSVHAKSGNGSEKAMTEQRFQFVRLNWRYDATEDLRYIECPTLAVFGEHDLNVNISESIRVYQEQFRQSGNEKLTVKVYSDAQHSLLKADEFPEIVPGIGSVIKLTILGDDAFADGFLDFVVNWIVASNNIENG